MTLVIGCICKLLRLCLSNKKNSYNHVKIIILFINFLIIISPAFSSVNPERKQDAGELTGHRYFCLSTKTREYFLKRGKWVLPLFTNLFKKIIF